MLETSQDLWWIVFALVTLWVGIFIGWCIFYLAMILRDMKKITQNIKKKLDLVDQILETIKGGAGKTASYLPFVIEGAGKIIKTLAKKKGKKSEEEEEKPKKRGRKKKTK